MNTDSGVSSARADVRACFFGDSFVAGVGDSTGLGWVGRVTAGARAHGHRLTSYNLGVRGETSTQVVARIPVEAPPRLADAEEGRLIISFGVNDTSEVEGEVRASIEEGVEAIGVAVDFIGSERLLMMGPPAVLDDEQNARIARLDRAFQAQAGRRGIRYVSTFQTTFDDATWRHEIGAGDRFHPNAEGYSLLADLVGPSVLDWLGTTGAS